MSPMSRLQTSSVAGSSSRYQSIVEKPAQEKRFSSETTASPQESSHRNAFHNVTPHSIPSSFSTESSERLPSYSSAITVLPVRELEHITGSSAAFVSRSLSTITSEGGHSFVTPMTPPRLPHRRDLATDSTGLHTAPSAATTPAASSRVSSSYNTAKSTITAKRSAFLASPVGPRGKVVTPFAATDFFTASEGSGSYFTAQSDARDPFRSITPSSTSHAAYSLDHTASEVSVIKTVASPEKPTTRIPVPSIPSSSSSSTTTRTSSSSTSTTRPGTRSTTIASSGPSLPRRILEAVNGNERARVGDTTAIVSQLNRIETAVADIGSFLSVSPASVQDAQSAATFRRSQNAPSPGSPSSPSSSSSSSSDTATLPGTPTEDDRLFRGLASIKEQNRALMEQQLKVQNLLESGGEHTNAPTLGRIEDLLLRLLERSADSEILMELGFDDEQIRHGNKSGYAASTRSKRTFASAHEQSMYSDEQGARAPAPAPSIDTQYDRERRARMREVPESLLEMSSHLTDELDEDWELQNLPPGSPDVDLQSRPRAMPPIGMLTRRNVQPESSHSLSEAETLPIVEPPARDQFVSGEGTPRPVHRPIMVSQPPSTDLESETTTSTTPPARRRPFRPGPTPRPVEIPSPVRPEEYPSVMPPPSFRPGMPYPRPSRLASGREPMTTT